MTRFCRDKVEAAVVRDGREAQAVANHAAHLGLLFTPATAFEARKSGCAKWASANVLPLLRVFPV